MIVAAAAMLVMLMMVVLMVCVFQLFQLCSHSSLAFHGLDQLLPGQFPPGSGDYGSFGIVLSEHCHGLVQLILGNNIGTGENDGGGSLDLVVIELTEVLHIYLHLACICHCNGVAQLHIMHLFHSADHIGQLANTGRLDDHTVGIVLSDHLLQRLAEITHQAAANAAGVHLGNVDACFLQEAAVNADLTKLIFDEHQLLAAIALSNHLLDQGSLAGAEEAGINIDFRHFIHLLYCFIILPIISP